MAFFLKKNLAGFLRSLVYNHLNSIVNNFVDDILSRSQAPGDVKWVMKGPV
jgi:hypothetical protein